MKYTQTRQPIVEGLFYPAEEDKLAEKIDELLKKNPVDKQKTNRVVLPHGGWDYTGDYIAKGFNALPKTDYKRVIIVSNVHREFENSIILPEAEYFNIGNKRIKVDLDAVKSVKKYGKKVKISNVPHMEEHGIEVVLPFVNHLYPEAKIVPILLGKTIVSLVRSLADIISSLTDDGTLIIVTSNFSGYEKEVRSMEFGEMGVELATNGKMGELVELTRTNKIKTCGAGALASLILMGNYKNINVLQKGLTPQTPLSGGKATYYATLLFNND